MTCDTWHLTPDSLHVTPDTWHMSFTMWWELNILSKFKLPSSFDLGVMMFWRLGGKGWLTDWLSQLMSNGGVCRTAPATPGLLKIIMKKNCQNFEEKLNLYFFWSNEMPWTKGHTMSGMRWSSWHMPDQVFKVLTGNKLTVLIKI